MKRIGLTMALVSLLALGGQAFASQCEIEVTPAATLLLPYFEVCPTADPNDPVCDVNTYFKVKNASDVDTVAHVVFWTDFSIPTLDFDIFLTGYDVQSINLCHLFATGELPQTADEAGDTLDMISPHGINPEWDSVIPGCFANLPLPPLPPILLDRIRMGHCGLQTLYDGACLGYHYGEPCCYRGYITIDNVLECNLLFPTDTGYFADGGDPLGVVSNVNQLWGDWAIVDTRNNYAQGEMLVHIEAFDCVAGVPDTPACVGVAEAWNVGDYTFYGRYVNATAIDNREPLVSIWATDYMMANPVFTAGTDLLVWRDAKDPDITPVGCPGGIGGWPPWFQLNQTQVVAFDEEENWTELCVTVGNVSPPLGILTCFPLETQRITLGPVPGGPGSPVNPPFDFGWLFLNLNHTNAATGLFGNIAQNWLVTVMNAHGVYSIGYDALALESSCTPSFNYLLP